MTVLCFMAVLFFSLWYKKNWKLIFYYFLYYKKRISQSKNFLSRSFGISISLFLVTILYILIKYIPQLEFLDKLIYLLPDSAQYLLGLLAEHKTLLIIIILVVEIIAMIISFVLAMNINIKQININNDLIIDEIVKYNNFNIISYFGSIKNVKDIDVIVTSENSDLDLASLSSTSISGRVRYMASKKNDIGDVIEDTLLNNINKYKKEKNKNNDYKLGTCIISLPFELENQGVKCIIHAVSIKKNSDNTIYCDKDAIKSIINYSIGHCVNKKFNSIFIPIFGIGSAQRDSIKSINLQLEQLKIVLDNMSVSITRDLDIYLGVYRELDDLYLKKTAFRMFR